MNKHTSEIENEDPQSLAITTTSATFTNTAYLKVLQYYSCIIQPLYSQQSTLIMQNSHVSNILAIAE